MNNLSMKNPVLFFVLAWTLHCFAFGELLELNEKYKESSALELETMYNSLDPHSLSELLSFYSLHKEKPIGQRAQKRIWQLLRLHRLTSSNFRDPLHLPSIDVLPFLALISPISSHNPKQLLTEAQLQTIEALADHLVNRTLKGFSIVDKQKLTALPSDEIDLARALLLYAFDGKDQSLLHVRSYEASLDVMALQILAYLPVGASDEEKVHAINRFIFHQQKFRFPPHSLWVQNVDLYTLLPDVLDSRHGVCLGVSVLYLALAQRLGLPLEIITPPGHIYLRYRQGDRVLNIETTAHGVSFPSKMYLGINTCSLQQRTLKEVIGLTFVNQASTAWQSEDYHTALSFYEQALPFLPDDPLLNMLLGYQYLLTGNLIKGIEKLKQVAHIPFEGAVYPETVPVDFLEGKVDIDGIQAVFAHVDETRASIALKQTKLQTVVKRHPKFRNGLFHLALTHLQLGHRQQALDILNQYHKLDPNNPVVEYYLAILSIDRLCYDKAWQHLLRAEAIAAQAKYKPQALLQLRHQLRAFSPDPTTLPQNKQSKNFGC